MTIYTVELQAHDGTGVITLYAASDGYNTGPSDTPANQHFRPTLQVPANFERALFRGGETRGLPEIGYGEIKLANADGRYDAWPDYAFDGRPCVVKMLDDATAPYASATVLLTGRVETVDVSDAFKTIQLRLYDPMVDLDRPLLINRYLGTTNAGGATAEGTTELEQTLKPRCYGLCTNIVPTIVNPFDLIYQVSDSAVFRIDAFDGGLPLTRQADFTTVAALQGAVVAGGDFVTAYNLGLFRLGATAARTVTADVLQGVNSGARTAGLIARQILIDAGLTTLQYSDASFIALGALNSATCGIRVQGETSVLSAVGEVLSGIGAWIAPNAQGVLEVGRLSTPAVSAVASFQEWELRGNIERSASGADGSGLPCWRVIVRYGRLGQVQNETDLVGAVSAARRSLLAVEWRQAVSEDATIKARWLNAPEVIFESGLTTQVAAQAEADRLLALFKVKRSTWRIRVDTERAVGIQPGQTVSLTLNRFLADGQNFVVIGRVDDCTANRVELMLWG